MGDDEWQPPSEEDFYKKWVTPAFALGVIGQLYRESSAKKWIMGRLKSGYISAVARQSEWLGNLTSYVPVPLHCWKPMTDWGDDHFWETGDTTFTHKGSVARLYDVRFDNLWGDSREGPQPSPQLLGAPETAANKGGAPRKAWWDDLWIEMIRRIRADELHPESAAQLQREMLDWLGEQGIYPGEDTLKKTARKLFKYLQE